MSGCPGTANGDPMCNSEPCPGCRRGEESELPPLSFEMPGERVTQYGGVKEFPRTVDKAALVSDAMAWAVAEVARVASELGIPMAAAVQTLKTYYVDGVAPAGSSSHEDPLRTIWARQHNYAIHLTVLVGWKFSVLWDGDVPEYPHTLAEGESILW